MVYFFCQLGLMMDGLVVRSCELLDQPCPEDSFLTREFLPSSSALSVGCRSVCSVEATGTVSHGFFLAGSSSQLTALTLLLYHCVQWCQFGPLFK